MINMALKKLFIGVADIIGECIINWVKHFGNLYSLSCINQTRAHESSKIIRGTLLNEKNVFKINSGFSRQQKKKKTAKISLLLNNDKAHKSLIFKQVVFSL